MRLLQQPWPLKLIWGVLAIEAVVALFTGAWTVAFVALATGLLTLVPLYVQRLIQVHIPSGFLVAIAVFLMATLFLGEVRDFYERIWWWDIALHVGSAVGFGLVGVVLMLILVKGERLQAAPITVALFAFCFAVMIGVLWEIWEFTMDQTLGTNTQKSGLVDTMWDLIVDCLGAAVGAMAGFLYLKGEKGWALTGMVREFVGRNRHLFRR